MSRLEAIADEVAVIVTNVFTAASETVTIIQDPIAAQEIEVSQLPVARIIFEEDDPERIDFRQQRRNVNGTVEIVMLTVPTIGPPAGPIPVSRDDVNDRLEGIRDGITSSETLKGLVDYAVTEASVATSSHDDGRMYGSVEVATEEVF